MRFESNESETAGDPQLAAMADIVFILLAFFVLTSTLRMAERDFAMGYEKQQQASGLQRSDLPRHVPLTMERRGADVIIAIGQTTLPAGDYDAITAALSEINLPELTVLLIADPALSVDAVAMAMDAVAASPMKRISLATLRTAGGSPPNGKKEGDG